MEQIGDLFGRLRSLKGNGKPLDERATLIDYFSKQVDRPAKNVGIRIAHYSLTDLYALQSMFKDRLGRNGKLAAVKHWWWITRTTKT